METVKKDKEMTEEKRMIEQISRILYEEHQITREEQLRVMALLRKG